MAKKHVVGYFVLRSGRPTRLDLNLDVRGLLVTHATDATLFLRNERSLQATKKQTFGAIRRTLRQAKKISQAGHIEFKDKLSVGKERDYIVHPCRSKHPDLHAALEECASESTVNIPLTALIPTPKPKAKKHAAILSEL